MAAYSLPTAIAQVKASSRVNFTYFEGKQSHHLFVSPRKLNATEKEEIEGECGAPIRKLFSGVCFKEDGQLIFATKQAPTSTRETMIQKVFKAKKVSASLKFELRQLGANESDDVTEPSSSEEPAAPAAPAATTEAATTTTPAAPAEPQEETAPAAGGALSEEDEYRKTKAEMTPQIVAAIKTNPPNKEDLLGKLNAALQKEKAGEYGNARALFFELMAATSSGNDAPPAPKGPPPPAGAKTPPPTGAKTPPPGGRALSAQQISTAMDGIVPRLKQAAAANPARQAEITAAEAKIRAAVDAGKLGDAQAALVEALSLVKTLTPAVDPAEEAAFATAWNKAAQVWQDCVDTVDGQIEKARTAMRESGDEDFISIADRGMAALTDNHKTPVMVAVREVGTASGFDRYPAVAKARNAIDQFRAHIFTDSRVAACDEECEAEFGVKIDIRGEITRGLDALESALDTVPGV